MFAPKRDQNVFSLWCEADWWQLALELSHSLRSNFSRLLLLPSDHLAYGVWGLIMMDFRLNCSADVVNWLIPHPIVQHFYPAQHCMCCCTKRIDNQPLIFINSGWTARLQGLTVIQKRKKKKKRAFDYWFTKGNWYVRKERERKKVFVFVCVCAVGKKRNTSFVLPNKLFDRIPNKKDHSSIRLVV